MGHSRLCSPLVIRMFPLFCSFSSFLTPFSTGYGQHGDYVFGWKDDSLQHAMDNRCFGPTCNGLTTQGFDKANACTVKPSVKEDNDGCKFPFLGNLDERGNDILTWFN